MAHDPRIQADPFRKWLADTGLLGMKTEYQQLAFEDQKAMLDLYKEFAGNPLSLKLMLQKDGMLNSDGTVNLDKMRDTDYLKALKEQAAEGTNIAAQTGLRKSLMSERSRGGVSSGANTNSLSKSISDMGRRVAQDYGQAYKAENERAFGKTMNWGAQALADERASRDERLRAAERQYGISAENAGAQSAGALSWESALNPIEGLKSLGMDLTKKDGQEGKAEAGGGLGSLGGLIGSIWGPVGSAVGGLAGNLLDGAAGEGTEELKKTRGRNIKNSPVTSGKPSGYTYYDPNI